MNSIEFAIRDGVPYAIDFMNPAPDMDVNSLTPHYFDWVVNAMADMAIRLAQQPRRQTVPSWERLFTARVADNQRTSDRVEDGAHMASRHAPRATVKKAEGPKPAARKAALRTRPG